MNSRLPIFGACLLVAAVAQARAQGVQLRYTPAVGQVTHYRMVNRTWASADTTTAPTTQVAMYQTQTVLAMDSGNYVVKTVTDSTVTQGGGGQRDPMRGMAVTVKMDPRGRVLSSQVTPPPGLPPFIANMMTRNSGSNDNPRTRVWPEGTINPGDTWTDSMTLSAGGGRGRAKPVVVRVTYKYERLEHRAGDRIVVISMNGAPQGGEGGTVAGEMAVDIDAGRMAHMFTDMTQGQGLTRMTMEVLP